MIEPSSKTWPSSRKSFERLATRARRNTSTPEAADRRCHRTGRRQAAIGTHFWNPPPGPSRTRWCLGARTAPGGSRRGAADPPTSCCAVSARRRFIGNRCARVVARGVALVAERRPATSAAPTIAATGHLSRWRNADYIGLDSPWLIHDVRSRAQPRPAPQPAVGRTGRRRAIPGRVPVTAF